MEGCVDKVLALWRMVGASTPGAGRELITTLLNILRAWVMRLQFNCKQRLICSLFSYYIVSPCNLMLYYAASTYTIISIYLVVKIFICFIIVVI